MLFGVKSNSSSELRKTESHAGRKMAIVRDYDHWSTVFPSGWTTWLKQNNYTISLSLNPKVGSSTVSWRSIANAQPGSAIHQNMVNRARAMANFGDKIFFTFHHEPNQLINQRYGSSSDFKAAYRKFSSILNAAGANNVIKVWTVTGSSFSAKDWRAASAWYPGGDVVDVVGADGYNWYTCLARGQSSRRPWTSFASVFEPARRFSAAQGKQLLINEYGSTEDPGSPGRKGKWFVEAKNTIKSPGWGHLRALLYYESGSGNCNWHVGTSSSSIAGFRSFGGDPYMSGTL